LKVAFKYELFRRLQFLSPYIYSFYYALIHTMSRYIVKAKYLDWPKCLIIWNGMSTFLYLTIKHTFAMLSDEFKYMYTAQLCMVPGQATKSSDHPITT